MPKQQNKVVALETAKSRRNTQLEKVMRAINAVDIAELNPEFRSSVVNLALRILEDEYSPGQALTSPSLTRQFLRLKLGGLEHEVFFAIFLDSQHQVLATEALFSGSIDGASVYPREVVKKALSYNSAAIIFAHNHPSGVSEPSEADKRITSRLKQALALMDIRVLDHIVVGAVTCVSFAERGLL